ncbi:hypothetical protein SK128_015575 [Halocaridina rubra]|uniref:Fibronectin type-III domain-containing protein n=1 Tax=Halocaridina rubra TaxID=373956 RepID=A0AAN8XGW4_HALRR
MLHLFYTLSFQRQGVPLQVNSNNEVEVTEDSLILRSITRSSTGNYTCAAANTEGATTSNTLLVEVKFPPTCSPGQQMVFGAARHEQLHVACNVEAHPLPHSFRWAMNTSTGLVDIALSHSNSSGSKSIVRYKPQTHLDFGDLLCWGSNDVGTQRMPCVFHIIPAAKPEPVSECVAERNSSMPASYVVVSCMAGWGGGLNQSFTLEVRQKATEEVLEKFSLAASPNFVITGLKVGVPYLLTVTSANSRGSGLPITLSYTPPAASADKVISPYTHSALLSFTPLLIILVGVLTGIVTCVGVGVVVSRRRGKWRKKEQVKMVYSNSLKNLPDAQDLPIIIRLTKDCEKEESCVATANSSPALYVNPAKLLNNYWKVFTMGAAASGKAQISPYTDTKKTL